MIRPLLLLVTAVILCGCREPAPVPAPPSPATLASEVSQLTDPPKVAPVREFSGRHIKDTGIFSEFDARLEVKGAEWLGGDGVVVAVQGADAFLFRDGRAVRWVGDAEPDIVVSAFRENDRDRDGIPDQFDILLGAKKTVLNAAPYGSPYREMEYPGGDVPRSEGVCTDVVIRALRNAGVDLQKELHEDIVANPRAFPMVKTANANIDQRRVKTLLPHFERTWDARMTAVSEDWLPGDIVFMNTMGDERPDHIGIVSDSLGESGAPLIINNWTDGYHTQEMDLANFVPITHRFRLPGRLVVPLEHAGVAGLIRRAEVDVADAGQLLVVNAASWTSADAVLRRVDRTADGWRDDGSEIRVTLGSAGMGAGLGVSNVKAPVDKVEGDRRSPAGAFRLGTAFGRDAKPYRGAWPYRRAKKDDFWVDDPGHSNYNRWTKGLQGASSGEQLTYYDLALVVEHNTEPIPGRGSAIFLHTWQGISAPTLGCTAMKRADLIDTIEWLNADAEPRLVQVVGDVFSAE